MKTRITFDSSRCTGCGACAIACMDQNDIDLDADQQPFRRIQACERNGRMEFFSLSCLHCDPAPCADACPKGCLFKDSETGLTLYDNTDCIGCRRCAAVCPNDALTFRPVGDGGRVRMEKCDGCAERIRAGMLPACVHSCPTGALRCSVPDSVGALPQTPQAF